MCIKVTHKIHGVSTLATCAESGGGEGCGEKYSVNILKRLTKSCLCILLFFFGEKFKKVSDPRKDKSLWA